MDISAAMMMASEEPQQLHTPPSYEGKLKLEKSWSENGCFAMEDIEKGEVILILRPRGDPLSKPTKHSIQINEDTHIIFDGILPFLNHNCEPNTYIDLETMTLRARCAIPKGKQAYWNYLCTEWNMGSPFECRCESKGCVKKIRGYKYLTLAQRQAIQDILAPHLKSRLECL
eukprot:TRINITY_DN6222_c0_g1_i2.p1 TRINITY_DN6222_c0_g1~~TRINITY_DN6222_c0_g1_i2.p1  ORF type:complete len:172 (-),score=27.11 TRINITY_DN6222_c0_g1_i2:128-643(-)